MAIANALKKKSECEKIIYNNNNSGFVTIELKIQSHDTLINSQSIKYKLNGASVCAADQKAHRSEMKRNVWISSVFFAMPRNYLRFSVVTLMHKSKWKNEFIDWPCCTLSMISNYKWEWRSTPRWCNMQMTIKYIHNIMMDEAITEDVIIWVWPS